MFYKLERKKMVGRKKERFFENSIEKAENGRTTTKKVRLEKSSIT